MKIRGIFCATTATTNEEYRKVLKRRNIWMGALVMAGILIAGTAWHEEQSQSMALPEYSIGLYCGFGVGIAIAGALLFIKNLILMRNEEKLRRSRLENADERLHEISSRASRMALMVLMFVIITGGMICGIYEPLVLKIMIFLIDIFAFSYMIAFFYYNRKM